MIKVKRWYRNSPLVLCWYCRRELVEFGWTMCPKCMALSYRVL